MKNKHATLNIQREQDRAPARPGFGTILVAGLYVACELIANVTAGKPVLLPGNLTVPAAVFVYALTFTLIDLVNDRLGKQGARHVVYAAFLANLLLAAYTRFAIWLPSAPFFGAEAQAAFAGVLGSTWRIVVASLIAYLAGTLIDVQVFAWWRERVRVRGFGAAAADRARRDPAHCEGRPGEADGRGAEGWECGPGCVAGGLNYESHC